MKLKLPDLAKAIRAIEKAFLAASILVRSLGGILDAGAYTVVIVGMSLMTALCWHYLDLLARG